MQVSKSHYPEISEQNREHGDIKTSKEIRKWEKRGTEFCAFFVLLR
jgi:hypothetical protein